MADDGWEAVTDPNEMKKVLGAGAMKSLIVSDGQAGVGANESKTRENQFTGQPVMRQLAMDLATAYGLNSRLPTGRFAANVNAAGQQFPSSWQPNTVADYQKFLALQQSMAKPVMAINSPSGQAPSAQEMNTPKELEMAMNAIPGPSKERDANNFIIDRVGRATLNRTALNAFSNRWRSKFGSVYGKDAQGRDMSRAFQDYQQSPAYKSTVMTPFTKLLRNGGRAPGSAKPAAQVQKPAGTVKFLGFEE